jgi:flagellar FliL protein
MRLLVLLFSLMLMPVFAHAEEGGGHGGEEKEDPNGVRYVELKPKFVVNLSETKRYLQISVQLLIEGSATADLVKKHMPAIKHELIMLFSDRPTDSLQTMEQREALRQATIETLHKIIDKSELTPEAMEKEEAAVAAAAAAAAAAANNPELHSKGAKKRDYSHLPSGGLKDVFFTEFLLQ